MVLRSVFEDYLGRKINLHEDTWQHIRTKHPEIKLITIRDTVAHPDEVRVSKFRSDTCLYYSLQAKKYYTCVVVKFCNDGNFIATSMTADKTKHGKIVYKR